MSKNVLNFNRRLSRRDIILMVLRLSIPAIMAEVTSIVMQYIDAGMVGSLGAEATAAIGLVSTTTWLIGGLCIAVSTGFSVQVAQLVGAGRVSDSRNVFRQAIVVAVIWGIIITTVAVSISGALPHWLGGEEEICADASRYFRIYAGVLLVVQLRQLCGAMLQCSGDMKTPSILNIILCALDVVFNFFFIFPSRDIPLFGIRLRIFGMGMGVSGAALGTAAAEICITVLMLYAACVKSDKLSIHRGGSWRLRKDCMRTAAKIAIPSAFEHSIMCSAYVAMTLIVAPLGTTAIAANSLGVTAESFCYMPGYGIGSAATTLVGQSIGAKRKDIARKCARLSVLLGVLTMSATAVLMYFAAPAIFGLLTSDMAVRELGVKILRIEAFAEPLYAASIVCAGALRGAGDTLMPSILSLISMWGVRITAAAILTPYLGLYGVWIAMCGELCVRGILFLVRLLREKWLEKNIAV